MLNLYATSPAGDEAEIKAVDLYSGLDSTLTIELHRLKPQPHRPEIQVIQNYDQLSNVECYSGQLHQFFMDFLTNAIDFIDEDWVHLQLQNIETISQYQPSLILYTKILNNSSVYLQFIDNVPGIPNPMNSQLFDPFLTTKTVGKETGLG
ncbi:MAG: hypothetical protein WBA13_13570 [Microcoleaceae cyanobacterium]